MRKAPGGRNVFERVSGKIVEDKPDIVSSRAGAGGGSPLGKNQWFWFSFPKIGTRKQSHPGAR